MFRQTPIWFQNFWHGSRGFGQNTPIYNDFEWLKFAASRICNYIERNQINNNPQSKLHRSILASFIATARRAADFSQLDKNHQYSDIAVAIKRSKKLLEKAGI